MKDEVLEARKEALVKRLTYLGALKTAKIIEAFIKFPRHKFVTEEHKYIAYDDIALPIVKGSTISQPYTVAIMMEALEPKVGERVLEIGSGSGWQACMLAYCVGSKGRVFSMEIDEDVAAFAKKNAAGFRQRNLKMVVGDGSVGYGKEAPYSKIIYTAATPKIPKRVLKQLKVGGRIVAPIGSRLEQTMTVVDKISEEKYSRRQIGGFLFVPLTGELGF